MKKIGIICEYNPFHNGHVYHIKKIKELFPDSLIILVLSSYFTQRGDVSLLSKYDKVYLSLKYGVDLVIEMPCIYVLNSADTFANLAVGLLNKLKVNHIVFGSELNNIEHLTNIIHKSEEKDIVDKIKIYLKDGNSYPASISKALNEEFKSNDILAISYIRSINKINKSIIPVSIKRTNDYNDLNSNSKVVSGNNIREKLKNKEDISKFIPEYEDIKIREVDQNKLFILIKYKILTETNLTKFLGVDEGIEHRIQKAAFESDNMDELIRNIKSKRYTYLRIKRLLMHILLGILKTDAYHEMDYFRVIGFNNSGKSYLKNSNIKGISFRNTDRIEQVEFISSQIYDFLTDSQSFKREILNKPVISKDT